MADSIRTALGSQNLVAEAFAKCACKLEEFSDEAGLPLVVTVQYRSVALPVQLNHHLGDL